MKDAFGEPPRQAIVLLRADRAAAAGQMFGIDSIIQKEPDVVLTVTDAGAGAASR